MKAKYRKYTWLYMCKLRYTAITCPNLREYSKANYFENKAYKYQKQRNHLFRKFHNKLTNMIFERSKKE